MVLNELKKILKENSTDYLILCLFAVVITILWFHEGLPIARGEAGMPFEYPDRWLYHGLFTWSDIEATGLPNARPLPYVPLQFFMYVLSSIGFSSVLREAVVFFFLLVSSGLSMYSLTQFLVPDKQQRLASLCAGIFYMVNPFTIYSWHRLHTIIYFLPFIPLIFLMYLKGITEKENLWKNALFFNVAVFLSLAAFVNPTYLLSCILLLVIVFLFFVFSNLKNFSDHLHTIKFTLTSALLGALLNLWWVLPLMPSFSSNLESAASIAPLPTLKILSSNYFQFQYVVRLFESNTFNLLPFSSNAVILFLTFIPPILAFCALLLEKKNKNVLFFSILAVFGIFLCTGSSPPLGDLFVSLFEVFPLSAGFRNPYDKFGMLLMFSYSFLVGVSISSISWKLFGKIKNGIIFTKILTLVLLILIIVPSGISVFSGAVFNPEGSVDGDPTKITEYYTKIPSYYNDANEWLSSESDVFRIISFPLSPNDFLAYDWESGYSGTAPWNLWDDPVILSHTWYSNIDEITRQMSLSLDEGNEFWKIMSILNAKYAVVQKDYEYWRQFEIQAGYSQDPEYYIKYLQYPELPDYDNAQKLQMEQDYVPDYDNSVSLLTKNANWTQIQVPQHNISINSLNSTGYDSVKVVSLMDGDLAWEGGVKCTFENHQNLSQYDYVSFWINFDSLDSVGRVYFGLEDVYSNYKKWEITDQVDDSWTRITIPLNSTGLWESTAELDLNLVSTLQVTLEKKQGVMNSTIWWIDDIQGVPEIMIEYLSSIDHWVPVMVPSHVVSLDPLNEIENQSSTKIVSHMEDDLPWEGGVTYTWTDPLNLTCHDYFTFWINFDSLDSVGRVYFGLEDVYSNYKKWEITDQVDDSWTRITIPLNSTGLWESTETVDYSSIPVVTFSIEKKYGEMNTTTWWLGGLQAEPKQILKQMYISESETFGDLTFFEVDQEFFSPIIFTTSHYDFASDIETMVMQLMTTSVDPRNVTYFITSQLSEQDNQTLNSLTLNGKTPELTFEKIDPTKYSVSVENSTGGFFLVFSTTFDDNWNAYVNNQQISDEYHFVANGYANVWYVDQTGSFTVTLEFWPQQLFYVGVDVSLATLVVCSLYLSRDKLKVLYYKYIKKEILPKK